MCLCIPLSKVNEVDIKTPIYFNGAALLAEVTCKPRPAMTVLAKVTVTQTSYCKFALSAAF